MSALERGTNSCARWCQRGAWRCCLSRDLTRPASLLGLRGWRAWIKRVLWQVAKRSVQSCLTLRFFAPYITIA